MKRVMCMMSGGVDSNVAAYLLKQEGYEVIGVTLSLWWSDDNTCCGVAANCRAMDVCEKLGIEHYSLNKRGDFMKYVVNPFISSHQNNETPSPCVNCNANVKIGGMLKYADFLDCEYVATGHYVLKDNGSLYVPRDLVKDQTYMLSMVPKNLFSRLIFPLGSIFKEDVRKIADENGLASPKDSQDLCFVQKEDRKEFLESYGVEYYNGDILHENGVVLGKHDGVFNYTVGQRRGLGLGNGLYVIRTDKTNRQVIVGPESSLFKNEFRIRNFNWIEDIGDYGDILVKTRYKSQPVKASFMKNGEFVECALKEPGKSITPGQCAVFYTNQKLIGGGWMV